MNVRTQVYISEMLIAKMLNEAIGAGASTRWIRSASPSPVDLEVCAGVLEHGQILIEPDVEVGTRLPKWLASQFSDVDVQTGEKWTVNRDAVQRGLQIVADKYPARMGRIIDEYYDADTADVFLQCICFGKAILR